MRFNLLVRKTHSWGAIIAAAPVLIILATGILLQLKKQLAWVQPPEQRGTGTVPTATWEQILAASQSAPGAGVSGWDDVRRIDVRPDRVMAKVWTRSGYEVQVDLQSARVLQVAVRRSDLIESLHDGSWFHDVVKLGVFLPAGLILLVLWITGIYLFLLPIRTRRRRLKPAERTARRVPGSMQADTNFPGSRR